MREKSTDTITRRDSSIEEKERSIPTPPLLPHSYPLVSSAEKRSFRERKAREHDDVQEKTALMQEAKHKFFMELFSFESARGIFSSGLQKNSYHDMVMASRNIYQAIHNINRCILSAKAVFYAEMKNPSQNELSLAIIEDQFCTLKVKYERFCSSLNKMRSLQLDSVWNKVCHLTHQPTVMLYLNNFIKGYKKYVHLHAQVKYIWSTLGIESEHSLKWFSRKNLEVTFLKEKEPHITLRRLLAGEISEPEALQILYKECQGLHTRIPSRKSTPTL